MALREKLEDDIKTSMRSHDQARLDALRFFKNAVLAVEKEQKKELDDAGVIEVATKQASDRRDSIKAFEEGGREAAAAKEAAELVVLEEFLPPQMSAEELIGSDQSNCVRGWRGLDTGQGQAHGQADAPGARQSRWDRG